MNAPKHGCSAEKAVRRISPAHPKHEDEHAKHQDGDGGYGSPERMKEQVAQGNFAQRRLRAGEDTVDATDAGRTHVHAYRNAVDPILHHARWDDEELRLLPAPWARSRK